MGEGDVDELIKTTRTKEGVVVRSISSITKCFYIHTVYLSEDLVEGSIGP